MWLISGRDGSTLRRFESGSLGDGFGANIGLLGDVDEDGVDDLFVAGDTRVFALSMASGKSLWANGSAEKSEIPALATTLGDVNGDGHEDVFAQVSGRSELVVLSATSGEVLRATPRDWPAYSLGPCGDFDGDGLPDVLALGRGEEYYSVRSSVISSGTGTELWAGNSFANLAGAANTGNLDGDGRPNLVVHCSPNEQEEGSLEWISRKDGVVHSLRRFSIPGRCEVFAPLSDLDGDGIDEIALGEPRFGEVREGRVLVIGSQESMALYELECPDDAWHFGSALAVIGDVNQDGSADFVVGVDHYLCHWPGFAFVYSGKNGALLFSFHHEQDRVVVGRN